MTAPLRLTVVLTHPIQYYAPWFRHIEQHAPQVALTAIYATQPTPEQQGVGFGRAFEWDIPLTDGYRSVTVRPASPGDRVDSAHFWGLDAPEIGDAIRASRPDVVLIPGWYSVTLVRALIACRRLGVPTLYRGDSNLASGPPRGWRRAAWSLKTRLMLRLFDGFASPGVRATAYLRRFGVPAHRIFQVPAPVDNEMFAAAASRVREPAARADARRALGLDPCAFVPLYVGKLVPFKRPLDGVRAVALLGSGVTLLLAGAGELGDELAATAKALGVDLRAAGFVNQSELGRVYGIADCLILPSDAQETWGLVVNEALATGLPCVVSESVGCRPDLIREGETGYTHPMGDIRALAAALGRIRSRKAEGWDWMPDCRRIADTCSYELATDGLVHACRSTIRHSPAPEPDWNAPSTRVIVCCAQMVIAGGMERMTFEVVRVLTSQGAAVHAIVNGWENFRITPLAEQSGASWSVGPDRHSLVRRLTPLGLWRMGVELARVSGNLLRVSRRVKPTHVLLPDFQATLRNVPALIWLRARGVRVVARLGNAPAPGRFYRVLWRWIIAPVVDLFVTNSEYTRRELLNHGVPAAKIETIPNRVGWRAQSWNVDGPRIPGRVIFVGQVIPEKGLDLLVDAIAIVRGRGIDATLDVVGDMEAWEAPSYLGYRARVRERAGRDDLRRAVQFLGWREDVPALLSVASLHCCPSRAEQREAFGNVVLEAKLSKLPSIVTPSGNLQDLVRHKIDGWICDRFDADALAEAIEFFLTRPDRLTTAGEAALESAASFDGSRFAARWSQVFSLNS
jgi:glycosyltransferase involved in cell wall biosynthesis